MRKTEWFMISNWLISDDKKNNSTNVYIGPNEKPTKPGIEPQNPKEWVRHIAQ